MSTQRNVMFRNPKDVENFVAMHCGEDDVGLTLASGLGLSPEDWAIDITYATLAGARRAARYNREGDA